MKVPNSKLVNSVDSLQSIGKLNLPVKTSFAIAVTLKEIDDALTVFNAEREKIINKYAELNEYNQPKVNEQGNVIITNVPDFNKDLNELLAIEVELNVNPISVEALGDIQLPPTSLMSISWILTND